MAPAAQVYISQEILILLVSLAFICTLFIIIIFWQFLLGSHADRTAIVDPPLLPVDPSPLPLGPPPLPIDPPQPEQRPNHHYHEQLHQMFVAQHHRKKQIVNLSHLKKQIILPPLVKLAIKADLKYAKERHEATTGLPARTDTFHPQYSLNDVRKAAFHLPLDGVNQGYIQMYYFLLLPVPHLFNTTTQTQTAAKEFPVISGGPGYLVEGDKGPARIRLSEGPHFEAVIAHDPTLPVGAPSWDDHCQAAHRWIGMHEYFTKNTFIC